MSRITDLKRNFDLNKKIVRFIRVFEIQAHLTTAMDQHPREREREREREKEKEIDK